MESDQPNFFMDTNKVKTIAIKEGQFLKDIKCFKLGGIPSDMIIYKLLTGCGATTLELEWMRNSLIIEPNVPVIIGKCAKYNTRKLTKILGVYEDTSDDDIIDYLQSDIPYKKILVTPESFHRVTEFIGDSIYTDYFLLFDECERTIQDVSYRANVILPMIDFFKFDQKAFISATPIEPSDPRFKAHNFKHLKLKPKFDHKEDITILTTNNIITTLKEFLNKNPRERYFIFFNSTDNIAEVIQKLNIKDESAIYCSRDSRKKLRLNEYTHVHTELKSFKKYNFFTSRFYSAVDIDYELYEHNPTIIMLTDLVFAQHSTIDPLSEAIQIVGRFRKPQDIPFQKELVHISSLDADLPSMTKSEVEEYIKECHVVYKVIRRYYIAATHRAAKATLKQMLEKIDYSKYVHQHDGSRNYYMVDNTIHQEKVKGYYQSRNNLLQAYKFSQHFNITKKSRHCNYAYTDHDRLSNRKGAPLKSLNKIVSETINDLMQTGKYTGMYIQFEMANLQIEFPLIMAPINQLGIEESAKLKFDLYQIKDKLKAKAAANDYFGLMTYVKDSFVVGTKYTTTRIEEILEQGLQTLGLNIPNTGLRLLRKFCELSKDRVYMGKDSLGNDIRGYLLIKFLDTF